MRCYRFIDADRQSQELFASEVKRSKLDVGGMGRDESSRTIGVRFAKDTLWCPTTGTLAKTIGVGWFVMPVNTPGSMRDDELQNRTGNIYLLNDICCKYAGLTPSINNISL